MSKLIDQYSADGYSTLALAAQKVAVFTVVQSNDRSLDSTLYVKVIQFKEDDETVESEVVAIVSLSASALAALGNDNALPIYVKQMALCK